MLRQSSNFQITQLMDESLITESKETLQDFRGFIYKDHVTRIKYNVQSLRTKKSDLQTKQPNQTFQKHRYNKSMGNLTNNKFRLKDSKDQIEIKKNQLCHFLQQLVIMKKIKYNRNHIVSGMEKAQKRKSFLPLISNGFKTFIQKQANIDTLKQKIRQQVSSLNTQLFREYIERQKPFRQVFNQLNTASNKGALNTRKIKQIKRKLKQCIKTPNNQKTDCCLIEKPSLDAKQNQFYDRYFEAVTGEIDEQIRSKMRHEASFNWKYGRRPDIDELYTMYKSEHNFSEPLKKNS